MPGQSVCQVVVGPPNFTEANVVGTVAGQIWTGLTWPNDQASEITVTMTGSAATTLIQLHVRNQGGASYSGYRAIVTDSGAWEIDAVTAGTPTTLVSGTGLTIGANDKWTFQAAGSCLTLYQNNTFVGYHYDATYPSGTPGYSQESTTTLPTSQVFSWRGYNAVQQDGIWTKRGIAIPASAADLAVAGQSGPQNGSIIYEGNAQILSGTVYKMWFAAFFNGGTNGHVGYAESLDGLAWTRRATDVLVANGVGYTPNVFKVGATYHLYDCSGGLVHHFTSADGISWSAQPDIFTKAGVAYFSVLAIISGTWYATYLILQSSFPLLTGLATSSDGVTWTDQGIVVSNFFAVTKAVEVNGIWYAWGSTANPSIQDPAKTGIDPGEGLRMQTTDFVHWTNPVKSLHHAQFFEAKNSPHGGCYPGFSIDVNGKAFFYFSAGPDDDILTANTFLQIGVATGPSSIANIVTAPENALQRSAQDLFSVPGDLSGNWTKVFGLTKLTVVSAGVVEASALNVVCGAFYSGQTFSPDQYSQITIGALTGAQASANTIVLWTRVQPGAQNYYQVNITGLQNTLAAAFQGIYIIVAGSATLISPSSLNITPNVGDVFTFTAVGSNPVVLSLYQNDRLICQTEDLSNTYTSGSPGFGIFETANLTQTQVSSWAGGNANVIPAYLGGGSTACVRRKHRRKVN